MNNGRTLNKIFNTKPNGVRRVGRPKLRWEDGVDQDLKILEVKDWKKFALDRHEWAKLLNTFTAKIDHSRFNNSCLRLPTSTLVDLIFQLRRENCTAASIHLVDVIFIPFIVYYAYIAI
jgi:hypothetical protein